MNRRMQAAGFALAPADAHAQAEEQTSSPPFLAAPVPAERRRHAGEPRPLDTTWDRLRTAQLERVEVVEHAVLAAIEGELAPELRDRARRSARRLEEVATSFDLTSGARVAAEIEGLFRRGDVNEGWILRLSDLAILLRDEFEQPAPPALVGPEEDARALLILTDHPEHGGSLALEAASRGLLVQSEASAGAAWHAVNRAPPDVALLDLDLVQEPDGRALLDALRGTSTPCALYLLAGDDTPELRMQVAALGHAMFLCTARPAEELLDTVLENLSAGEAAAWRVLVADDDPSVLVSAQDLLGGQGLEVHTLTDPAEFWATIEQVAPDLVLLDEDLGGVKGTTLCRAIRGEPRWRTLPVIFLTDHADGETAREVFLARADDYVTKPIVGHELLLRVTNRLERERVQHRLLHTDQLTGVPNRRHAAQALERLFGLAEREQESLALAVLRLDGFSALNRDSGPAAGDAALRRFATALRATFRGTDVVARWGGAEFVIGMYALSPDLAVARLEALRRGLSGSVARGGCTFSAVVAAFPIHGRTVAELHSLADGVLHRVQASGGNRVVDVTWQPKDDLPVSTETVDIAIVEDDEVLSGLLRYTLETQGYKVTVLTDGTSAEAALAAKHPALHARTILLDVSLPGLDGLSLLRSLATAGRVRESRVIMLTDRATEREALQALETGAFDYVSKPFSLPILVQRIKRTLDT